MEKRNPCRRRSGSVLSLQTASRMRADGSRLHHVNVPAPLHWLQMGEQMTSYPVHDVYSRNGCRGGDCFGKPRGWVRSQEFRPEGSQVYPEVAADARGWSAWSFRPAFLNFVGGGDALGPATLLQRVQGGGRCKLRADATAIPASAHSDVNPHSMELACRSGFILAQDCPHSISSLHCEPSACKI